MFGSKKKKAEKKAKKKAEHSQKLREEAMANMRAARENLGDETVQKLSEIMKRMDQKETAVTTQARREIENADAERVAAQLLMMLEDRH